MHCRKDFDGRAVRWPGEVRVGTMTAALRQDRLAQALKRPPLREVVGDRTGATGPAAKFVDNRAV
ncbi:MAG: hypothetical protein AUG50_05060 [Betaproteobacteria bacterium 13_1_20CM_3_63_8]|nr:MAG: hypothetical protein AUG50_05060 [Betaproteobacteria bacterium 13_1_20CM_3_63_8]